MFETTLTLVGRLATSFQSFQFADGTMKATARMACTERRFDRAAQEWSDGRTLFITVVCWRGLAENAFPSLRSGDPVVAHGRLYSREFEKDGKPHSVIEFEAWSIGPDLQKCTAAVTRKPRAGARTAAETSWDETDDGVRSVRRDEAAASASDPWGDTGSGDVSPFGGEPHEAGAVPSGVDDVEGFVDTGDPWQTAEGPSARSDEAAVGV